MHVKKGDKVKILAGKEKGKTGVVALVVANADKNKTRVVVEGLNMMKHFTKPKKAGDKGGIIDVASPLHISNVALVDKKAKAEKKEKPAAKKKTAKKAE